MSFYVSIDQSTTSTTLYLYTAEGKLEFSHSIEFEQIAPKQGWLQHNFNQIWQDTIALFGKLQEYLAANSIEVSAVKSLGVANQRETTLAWDRVTGELLYDAVVWCDTRTTEIVEEVLAKVGGDKNKFKSVTGLPINTYFSVFKMRWLIQNVDAVQQAYQAGTVQFGTVNNGPDVSRRLRGDDEQRMLQDDEPAAAAEFELDFDVAQATPYGTSGAASFGIFGAVASVVIAALM